jgi:hypothetical protein
MARGDTFVAAGLAAFGAIWAIMALDLTYMGEFAPGSGFLPFWLGLALTLLSLTFLARRWRSRSRTVEARIEPSDLIKPVVVATGLAICVAAIPWLGFVPAVSCYLVALLKWLEHRSWVQSLAVGVGTPIVLSITMGTWLGVPLPAGPLGF